MFSFSRWYCETIPSIFFGFLGVLFLSLVLHPVCRIPAQLPVGSGPGGLHLQKEQQRQVQSSLILQLKSNFGAVHGLIGIHCPFYYVGIIAPLLKHGSFFYSFLEAILFSDCTN